ncbi:Sodium/potassium-transporting ATPase subunit alpha [Hypsibius exemplaris]|uniref:Na(+)/K(+)-exchanging ATPase n=1 Tax=Hypsibius exemplaris TaxID=2072580 RepID=A0A1W0WSS0_HYPEX|nr:Sodium/potassium-transporting ATPase subunit alpha [Hypsibius exemplaris]
MPKDKETGEGEDGDRRRQVSVARPDENERRSDLADQRIGEPALVESSAAPNAGVAEQNPPAPSDKEPRKTGQEIACQVNDSELLAKTIATQVTEDELCTLETRRALQPVSSRGQLHGILRKNSSARWASSNSTVCFDEHLTNDGRDRSRSASSVDTATGDSHQQKGIHFAAGPPRSESHGNSIRSDDVGYPSRQVNKHASFAELPLVDGAKTGVVHRPFWRTIIPQKKEKMTRSFTMEDLKKDLQMDDHLLPEQQLFTRVDVDPKTGLTDQEASKRLARDGRNMLTPPKKVPEIVKLMREFVGGFSPLLELGSVLCFIAFFLYAQKAKSEKIMEGFAKMLPEAAHVIRNGQAKTIPAEELVLGDIVELHVEDRIPADIRILEASSLKVDNSSLTGEAEPQSRRPEGCENPLESKNLAFYTTNCVSGFGKGVVIRRGDATVMGRIAKLTTRIQTMETTIAREMRHFVMLICIFAFVMGALCIIVALSMGYGAFYAVILAIGLVVANVPEGIIITVTVRNNNSAFLFVCLLVYLYVSL